MSLKYDRSGRAEAEARLIKNLPALRKTLEKDLSEQLPPVLSDILRPCLLTDLRDRPSAADVAKQFDDAITEIRRVPSRAESTISTGRRDLYWKRAIDLVDIDRYVSRVGLDSSQNAKECAEFLSDGERWIPGELHRLLVEIVSKKALMP
jgi:hypothetical protein